MNAVDELRSRSLSRSARDFAAALVGLLVAVGVEDRLGLFTGDLVLEALGAGAEEVVDCDGNAPWDAATLVEGCKCGGGETAPGWALVW